MSEVNREIADAPFSYGCCGPFNPFAYDGETMTMKFFREKEWMIGPPGDLYRFESKWIGNDLYWRSTANTWVFLATWEGDHYERWSDSIHDAKGKDHPRRRWRFERVDLSAPETLPPVERAISGPVGRWNYDRERAGQLEHQIFDVAACPAVSAAPGALGAATAAEPVETVRLTLKELKPEDALGMLRVMVDARRLTMGDEHSVGMTDTPANIQLARRVIDMVEDPGDEAFRQLSVADGTVIASVRLRHASVVDVGSALRAKADLARISMNVALSTVVVRDSPERVEAALKLIRELDTGQK